MSASTMWDKFNDVMQDAIRFFVPILKIAVTIASFQSLGTSMLLRDLISIYRPVSLTLNLCKVFESIMRDYIIQHLIWRSIN